MFTIRRSGPAMADSSIIGDNVFPCSQSGIDTHQQNGFHSCQSPQSFDSGNNLDLNWGEVSTSEPKYVLKSLMAGSRSALY